PESELYLETSDGKRTYPLERTIDATTRWHRLNFNPPKTAFRLVARSTAADTYLAFTAPEEIQRSSWLAHKFVMTSQWWLAAGLVLTLGALLLQPRRATSLDLPPPRSPWPIPVWPTGVTLALLAYAILLSRHLDPTAGPNDSGGYLNNAKLIAHNHLTAPPR